MRQTLTRSVIDAKEYSFCSAVTVGVLLLFASSCDRSLSMDCEESEARTYVHIAHTRTDANPDIIAPVENIDFSVYDMTWLGGDMAFLTSADDKTMTRIDSVFDVSNTSTLWALGNHDYMDLERVQRFTGRLPYYWHRDDDLTVVVVDTQDSLSYISQSQLDMFQSAIDQASTCSHFIVLSHKLIWMPDHPLLEEKIDSINNSRYGECRGCLGRSNFYLDLYPKLVTLQNSGVQVICIAGDIGTKVTQFEYKTLDGIVYLASGMEVENPNNRAIKFTHQVCTDVLSWEFVDLGELKD